MSSLSSLSPEADHKRHHINYNEEEEEEEEEGRDDRIVTHRGCGASQCGAKTRK
jgi:hypothetical protein